MLVLARKTGQAIQINDDITITVVEIRGDKVRLAFSASRDVTIHRKEVYEAIQRQPKT